MADVRFLKGNLSALPEQRQEGAIYFAFTDDEGNKGQIIFDKDSTHRYIMAASPSATVAFATCETDSLEAEKIITIQGNNYNWELEAGSSLFVRFSKTNLQSNPSFSVYGPHGQREYCVRRSVYCDGQLIADNSVDLAGHMTRIIHYVYDGNNFHFMGWSADGESTYDVATHSTVGLIKPWLFHAVAATGPAPSADNKSVAVNEISSVEGRYYALEMDSEGRGFVNVPWEESDKNLYALHIGPHTYDGSKEVTIDVYTGSMNTLN